MMMMGLQMWYESANGCGNVQSSLLARLGWPGLAWGFPKIPNVKARIRQGKARHREGKSVSQSASQQRSLSLSLFFPLGLSRSVGRSVGLSCYSTVVGLCIVPANTDSSGCFFRIRYKTFVLDRIGLDR